MLKYPKTLAACKAAEQAQWAIGDALLAEIPVGEESIHDDSRKQFAEAEAELKEHGFTYTAETLRHFRNVAQVFPAGSRRPALSLACHEEAGSPRTLQAVIDYLGAGVTPTWMMIREVVQAFRQKAEAERKVKLGQAENRLAAIDKRRAETVAVLKSKATPATKDAARDSLRQIEDEQVAARREKNQYRRPVRRQDVEIEPEEVPLVLASVSIDVLIAKARTALAEAERVANEHRGELSETQRNYIVKCVSECLNIAKRIVARVQLSPSSTTKLRVVKG